MIHHLVDLGDHNALLELGGLHDDGGVLRVGASVEVAVLVRLIGSHQGHPGDQIDEIPAEELQIGVDVSQLYLALLHGLGQLSGLGAGVGEVDLLRDALLKELGVAVQGDGGLHQVQPVDLLRIHPAQPLGQKIGLLLVVSLKVDLVAGTDDGL